MVGLVSLDCQQHGHKVLLSSIFAILAYVLAHVTSNRRDCGFVGEAMRGLSFLQCVQQNV
jgi:hypothetical protein